MPNIKGTGKCYPATCLQVILDTCGEHQQFMVLLYTKYAQPLQKVDNPKGLPSCHSIKLKAQECWLIPRSYCNFYLQASQFSVNSQEHVANIKFSIFPS